MTPLKTGRLLNPKASTSLLKNHNHKHIMNSTTVKGDWNVTKGKLKQKWANLTDDDLLFADGKKDELLGRIQKRTGETRDAVQKAIDDAEREDF